VPAVVEILMLIMSPSVTVPDPGVKFKVTEPPFGMVTAALMALPDLRRVPVVQVAVVEERTQVSVPVYPAFPETPWMTTDPTVSVTEPTFLTTRVIV